jgi:uncharacterized LabA/DUF88 family protein
MGKKRQKRIFVIFDGSNFYHLLTDKNIQIRNTLEYNYVGLANWLSGRRHLKNVSYYVGVLRFDKKSPLKSKRMIASQQKLFSALKKQKINLIKGYILKSGNSFHEKGVDVRIAVDMLVGAYENKYDTTVLISSDTDLIPAIEKMRELGKEVEYVGLECRPSFGLINKVSRSKMLSRDDIKKFSR